MAAVESTDEANAGSSADADATGDTGSVTPVEPEGSDDENTEEKPA